MKALTPIFETMMPLTIADQHADADDRDDGERNRQAS